MSTVIAGPITLSSTAPAIVVRAAGPFDTILGLPVHPLVVHAAVVLLPLSAVGVVVLFLVPRWRRGYAWLTLVGLAAGAAAAVAAKESGEQLARRIGEPADHARWGDLLPWVAIALLLLGGSWLVLAWRAARTSARADASSPSGAERDVSAGRRSPLLTVLGAVASVLAVGVLALTVVVGHTGAQAAWGSIASREGTAAAGPGSSAAPSGAATPGVGASSGSYTMAQVAQHNTATSCWAAINGNVYDLTSWISQHPGGPEPIQGLCGTDGTAAFTAQHGTQRRPANELASLKIGTLAAG